MANWKRFFFVAAIIFLLTIWADALAQADIFQDADAAKKNHDPKTAEKLLLPLAQQGDPKAQDQLAGLYTVDAELQAIFPGSGKLGSETEDNAAAFKWEHQAAEQGYATAQFQLGALYWRGAGVEADNVQAYMWYTLAVESKDADTSKNANRARDEVIAKMTPEQIAEGDRLVSEWKPTAAPSATNP